MPDKDKIISEVRAALDALFSKPALGNAGKAIWTKEVTTTLCNACKACNPNFHFCAKGVAGVAESGEWLYDVTCLMYDGDDYLKKIPLVAECEWGDQDKIYYDFEKLLLARADVRVMVFDSKYWAPDDDKFEEFAKYTCKYDHTQTGDTYLFAAWTPDKFDYRRIDAYQLTA